jgi:hypothetical protein
MWDLEQEVRRHLARAAGAGAAPVPEMHIRGGMGASPGFDQRAHLERVISYGTPPIKWCRQLLLRDLGADPAGATGSPVPSAEAVA